MAQVGVAPTSQFNMSAFLLLTVENTESEFGVVSNSITSMANFINIHAAVYQLKHGQTDMLALYALILCTLCKECIIRKLVSLAGQQSFSFFW